MGNCHVRSLNKPGRMSPKVAVVGLLKEYRRLAYM